jgi:hypothetical protein
MAGYLPKRTGRLELADIRVRASVDWHGKRFFDEVSFARVIDSSSCALIESVNVRGNHM